jgi:histidinol dehydrogenase
MIFKTLEDLSEEELEGLLSREEGLEEVLPQTSEILAEVGSKGDLALFNYTEKFDKVQLDSLRVSEEEIEAGLEGVDAKVLAALEHAAERIFAFHDEQRQKDLWFTEISPGVMVGQKTVPLDSVGAYIPGGRAAYPSSALMSIIPAKVAGVPRIVACTPPGKDGKVPALILAACELAGADEIYKLGGAQAVAAMALGTESIARVSKIVGPGNVYVTAAKMLVRGTVEIDFPAGPSEVLILADRSASPPVIAADMIAQAEHDPQSLSVLVSWDEILADAVAEEIKLQAGSAARAYIVQESLERSAILVASSPEEAVDFCNAFAPEHLQIMTVDPLGVFESIRNAGSVFLGSYTPTAAGDYASGTNHILPTSGYAKNFSGLNVDHFCKKMTVQMISEEGLKTLEDTIITLAEAEGLEAHAQSVRKRFEQRENFSLG